MKPILNFALRTILLLTLMAQCNTPEQNSIVAPKAKANQDEMTENNLSREALSPTIILNPSDFIPKNFVSKEKIEGDLNNDGKIDCVLLIKSTIDPSIKDDNDSLVDRNRRGFIVLINSEDGYQIHTQNLSCFSSEFEDGGIYYPPELYIEIVKNKLNIGFAHGRYGFWKYGFRFQKDDFDLIGYDGSQNNGSFVEKQISINYLTGKRLEKSNQLTLDEHRDGANDVFDEKWTILKKKELRKLSKIKDFDDME